MMKSPCTRASRRTSSESLRVRSAFRIGLGALIALVAVVLIRAAAFTRRLDPIPPLPEIALPKTAAVARLAHALKIPTVSRDSGVTDAPSFDALRQQLEKDFPLVFSRLSVETVNRHALLFTWTGKNTAKLPILLMAHTDVVPVRDPKSWQKPPFGGVIDQGYIWGRGSLDDKSSVIGILEATELLLHQGFVPERTIYLAFGHDEEVGGKRGAQAISTLLNRRGVRLSFVLDEGGVIVEGIVPGVTAPVALIGIAEKGYLTLRLEVETPGGHSSMPPAQTAIGILAAALTRIESNPLPPQTDHARRFFGEVGPAMPFSRKVLFANLWLFEPLLVRILSATPSLNATLRTTTAITMVDGGVKENVLPQHAAATINFRVIPGDTRDSVLTHIRTVVGDPRVHVRPTGDMGTPSGIAPSSVSSTETEGFLTIRQTIRQTLQVPDLVVTPYLVVGATDSRFFASISNDVYRFLPIRLNSEDLARIHGKDERIEVNDYLNTIRFYYLLLKNTNA